MAECKRVNDRELLFGPRSKISRITRQEYSESYDCCWVLVIGVKEEM
jgi:hypothetical protein